MKRKIFNIAMTVAVCITAIMILFTFAGCNSNVNTESNSENTPLILRYKGADGISFVPVENCAEYNADKGVLELEIDHDTEYIKMDELFKTDHNTKWVVYLDRMGTVAANTKILADFKNGENLYYISVFTSDELYVKTYCVNFYKNYTVNISFRTATGEIFAIPSEGNKFADSIRDRNAQFNQDGTITLMGDTVLTESPEYSLNGYTFNGWYNGNDNVKNYKLTQDTEFTASLTANKYEITLDSGEGSLPNGTENKKTLVFGENYTLPVAQREGYTFAGWEYKGEQLVTDGEGNSFKPLHIYDNVTFTATWTVNSYGIKFESANAGHGYVNVYKGENKQLLGSFEPKVAGQIGEWFAEVVYGEKLSFEFFPEAGYSFVSMNVNGMLVNVEEYTMPAKDVVFDVVWRQFTVEFADNDENKGSLDGAGAYTSGTTVTVTATPRKGYLFAEWRIDGSVVSTDSEHSFTMPSANVKLTAVWRPVTVIATLNYNNGSENGSQPIEYDSDFTLPVPTKSGYRFLGWYNANGVAITNAEGASIQNSKYTDAITLEAHYAPISVTIEFDYQGGEQGERSITVNYGESIMLPETTRYGYIFEGWRYGENNYKGAFTVNMDGNGRFVAQWTPIEVILTLENEPEQDKTQPAVYGKRVLLEKPTKTGYNFIGWKEKDGDKLHEGSGENVIIEKSEYVVNTTLVAQWKARTYNITLMNDGVLYQTIPYYYGQTLDLTAHVPSKTGYDFRGWFDGNDNRVTEVDGSSDKIFEYTQAVTFYAKWSAKQITATFDGNGSQQTPESITLTYNEVYNLPSVNKTGYSFSGWFIGSVNYSDLTGNKSTFTENVTFVAHWTPNTYIVTYSVTAPATVSQPSSTVTYDREENLIVPLNEGYSFLGWFMGDTAVSDRNGKIAKVTFTQNVTVTARWESTVITATIDPDNGEQVTTMPIPYGTNYNLGVPSANNGYEFIGWFDGDNLLTDKTGASLKRSEFLEDVRIIAKWNAIDVVIMLDANGGSIANNRIVAKFDATDVAFGVPIKTGYDFAGWKNGDISTNANGVLSKVNFTEATFVAEWTPKRLNITAVSEDNRKGTVVLTGETVYDADVTVTATPATGYAFVGWYRGGTLFSSENPYTFHITENVALSAKFEQRYTVITTEAQLKAMEANGEYMLGRDIRLSGNWTALDFENGFAGLFDGHGFKITGFNIATNTHSKEGDLYYGLFTRIAARGKVQNLTLEGDIAIETYNASNTDAELSIGLIAGVNYGLIENCTVSGTAGIKTHSGVTMNVPYFIYNVGGVAGVNYGTIRYTSSKVTLDVNDDIGNAMFVGGLVGANRLADINVIDTTVSACAVNATIMVVNKSYGMSLFAGLIAGDSSAIVSDVRAAGGITATSETSTESGNKANQVYVATFGRVTKGSVCGVYSDIVTDVKVVGGNARVAGICNTTNAVTEINNCFVKGTLNVAVTKSGSIGTAIIGYIFGESRKEDAFANCYYSADAFNLNVTVDGKPYTRTSDGDNFTLAQGTSSWLQNTLGLKSYDSAQTEAGYVWVFGGSEPKLFFE